jgi:hypothetical protein
MKFRTNLARYGLWIAASIVIAACSSQGQQGTLPETPSMLSAGAAHKPAGARLAASFKFQTINNNTDKTFNQLLGINDMGTISGYYGSGAAGHPNKGYTVVTPYNQDNFTAENVPGSAQTQVTCIDNLGNTGGFWINAAGVNLGFVEWNGVFTTYKHPKAKGKVTQILGLNDAGTAVGFYTDGAGANHGFTLNQATGKFKPVQPPGGANVTAAAINNNGDVVGFYGAPSGSIGFLEKNGVFSTFMYPKSTSTMVFGVNDHDAIVGVYVDTAGAMHGFLLESPLLNAKFTTIDDPNGIGKTTLNGINNNSQMVGFYEDTAGNTNGMLVTH